MKHKSVETTKLYDSKREEILARLSEVMPMMKKVGYTLAVAFAIFGGNGPSQADIQKVMSKSREKVGNVLEVVGSTSQDVSEWIKERAVPEAKKSYRVASENIAQAVETATPVVEKAAKDVSQAVGEQVENKVKPAVIQAQQAVVNLFDYSATTITDTQPSNQTVKLNISDLERAGLQKTISDKSEVITGTVASEPDLTPTNPPLASYGSEVKDEFYQVKKEENLSTQRPFDYQKTNDILQDLKLEAGDFLSPDIEKIKYFDAITNPNLEILNIFPERVMEWAPIIQEECDKFNSLPQNKDFQVSPNEALTILTIESGGNNNAYNEFSTATGGFQFMPAQFYNDYILTGAFDGGEGRVISYEEFRNKLFDKRYSSKLYIKFRSDMERYNQGIYQELGITSPIAKFRFRFAEYNGGQFNATQIYLNKKAPYETERYVRMATRIAIVGEVANELRDAGYRNVYNQMLSSILIDKKIAEAYKGKDSKNASDFKSTDFILKDVGQKEFTAGVVTRKLYLDEIPTVTPSATPRPYKYYSNPGINAIAEFEYRHS